MKLKNTDVSINHNKKLFLCDLDAKWICQVALKKRQNKRKTHPR